MTREQKLALIVGFSLILLVGVLISDHLSGARKAAIAKVEPEPAPMAASPYPVAPPEAIAERRSETNPMPPVAINTAPTTPPAVTPIAPGPDPSAGLVALGGEPRQSPTPDPEPVVLTNGRTPRGSELARADESSVANEIRRAGGELVRASDGSMTFRLPPAAGTGALDRSVQRVQPEPTAPRVTQTPVGPIETVQTHSVRAGESLYQIAAKYYGNGNLWRDLVKYNNMEKSGTVRAGMKIKVPSRDTLLGRTLVTTPATSIDPGIRLIKPAPATKAAAPKAAPVKPGKIELATYTVQKGDTLGEIALKKLGTSKRWQEIVDLNQLDDEDSLTPGSVLKLPARRS